MALMTWNGKFSVGVEKLDEQHHVLFEILNDMHAAMMKGSAQSMTASLVKNLVEYTRTHFKVEEALMATTNYPGIEAHCVQHRALMKQGERYAGRFERGEITLNPHLLSFLRDWLTNHIQRVDQEYGPWMNDRGVY